MMIKVFTILTLIYFCLKTKYTVQLKINKVPIDFGSCTKLEYKTHTNKTFYH